MAQVIGIQGVPLPPPLQLYPTQTGVPPIPNVASTNVLSLAAGQGVLIPSGTFLVAPCQYTQVQIQDYTTTAWVPVTPFGVSQPYIVNSDGQNYRLMNVSGTVIAAVVNASGAGYTSVPTVVSTPSGPTFQAIMGPSVATLSCVSSTAKASGVGYTIAPIINIAAPPTPGVQATAVCTISGGSIATLTILNPGANYLSVPAVVVAPHPFDTNFNSTSTTATTGATVTASISYAGSVAQVIVTNAGGSVFNVAPALTFSGGGGSGAAATAVLAQTITGVTVTTGGSGYSASVALQSYGGSIESQTSGIGSQMNSPWLSSNLLQVPRQATITATLGSGSGVQIGTIVDGGLFSAAPGLYATPQTSAGSGAGVTAVFGLTMGGGTDTVLISPL